MRLRAVLAFCLLLVACGGSEKPDTDCAAPDLAADRVRFASMVLLGTATDWDGTTAKFTIEEIWRGPSLSENVEIVPEPGRVYQPGVRYLVFPTDGPSPLTDARCSATTRWNETLAELRPATARAPDTAIAEDLDLPWEWLIAGLLLLAVGTAAFKIVERRRHPEPAWDPDFTFGGHAEDA